jgi:acetyl-CoA carboxylase alpha subunit
LAELVKLSKEQLLEKRYARYRALGELDDGKVIDINEAAS